MPTLEAALTKRAGMDSWLLIVTRGEREVLRILLRDPTDAVKLMTSLLRSFTLFEENLADQHWAESKVSDRALMDDVARVFEHLHYHPGGVTAEQVVELLSHRAEECAWTAKHFELNLLKPLVELKRLEERVTFERDSVAVTTYVLPPPGKPGKTETGGDAA